MVVKVFLTLVTETGHRDEIYDILRTFEEINLLCRVNSGTSDIVGMVYVDTLDDYRLFIERVATIQNVEDFESFITVDS